RTLTLGPPVPDPEKVLCIGLNYLEHQQESASTEASIAQEVPRFPVVFTKFASSLIGHDAPIDPPAVIRELDFEAELAVVIGREARNVPRERALEYVAGYSAFHDVSARDLQFRTSQWTMG